MIHFRIRLRKAGNHVSCVLFAGPSREATHANCGTWRMRVTEWEVLERVLNVGVETIQEAHNHSGSFDPYPVELEVVNDDPAT